MISTFQTVGISAHFPCNSSAMLIPFNILHILMTSSTKLFFSHFSHRLFLVTFLSLGLGQLSLFRTPAIFPWTLSNTGVFSVLVSSEMLCLNHASTVQKDIQSYAKNVEKTSKSSYLRTQHEIQSLCFHCARKIMMENERQES